MYRLVLSVTAAIAVASVTGTTSAVVPLHPHDDIQRVIDAHPPGTTYQLVPGIFRMQQIKPRSNDIFLGDTTSATVLTGARVLDQCRRDPATNLFVCYNQTQHGQIHGECAPNYPRCNYPEDLFFDQRPLHHVNNLSLIHI